MQHAHRGDVGRHSADPSSRVNKFVAAGVAVVGAGAIAVNPISPVTDVVKAQERAVQLTAAANPTYADDPAEVYGNLFAQSVANLTGLGETLTANPFPILQQVIANQLAYGGKVVDGITGVPEAAESWWNGNNGRPLFEQALAHLEAGEYADAWDRINRSFVYALNIGAPLYSILWSQAPSARNPEGNMGIPEQLALNLTDVVQAVFDRNSIVNGSTVSILGPVLGLNFEAALLADAIGTAVEEGDYEGVITALVNAPGVFANSFLNGYKNPECEGAACDDEFPGLINATSPLRNLFVDIPNAIAEALKPNPVEGAPYTPPAPAPTTGPQALTALDDEDSVTLKIEPAPELPAAKAAPKDLAKLVSDTTVVDAEVVDAPAEDAPAAAEPVAETDVVTEEGAEATTPATKKASTSTFGKKTQDALKKVRADVKKALSGKKDAKNKSSDTDSDSKSDSTTGGKDSSKSSDSGSDKSSSSKGSDSKGSSSKGSDSSGGSSKSGGSKSGD